MDVIDAFVRDDTFEYMMDAIISECSEEQWEIIQTSLDLAREELAMYEKMNEQPTTITARQFLADGYAVKVGLGDCGVYWRDLIIKSCDEKGELFNCVTVDRLMPTIHFFNPTDQFAVEWARSRWTDSQLPATEQPVPVGGEGETQLRLDLEAFDNLFCTVHPDSSDEEWKPFMDAQDKLYDNPDEKYHMLFDLLDAERSASKSLHNQYLTEKDRYETLYKEHLGLQQVTDETYDAIWDIAKPDAESWDYPAQIVRYVENLSAQLAALTDALKSEKDRRLAYGVALEKIANKSDSEKPIKLEGETDHSYGRTFGQWEMGKIAREALDAAAGKEPETK